MPNQKIIMYDIGMTAAQKDHFKKDERFIFRRFPFKKYPKKTVWLTGMSWKAPIYRRSLESREATGSDRILESRFLERPLYKDKNAVN